jgi:ribonuclease T2
MKKEVFNILFLGVVVIAVAWLYWPKPKTQYSEPESYVLALSWQPAFCEGRPNLPECRSQRNSRFDASNLSLHGLWPQPRDNTYCNLPSDLIEKDKRRRWGELPKLELSKTLRKELSIIMPGFRSNLHRHEWYKHGVCMAEETTPERYYQLSLAMLEQINKSELRNLMVDNIGKEISANQIKQALDNSFGRGAGERVSISCKRDGRRTLITELKISALLPEEPGAQWILQAPVLKQSCKRGIVDPVGLQ